MNSNIKYVLENEGVLKFKDVRIEILSTDELTAKDLSYLAKMPYN